MENTEIMNIEEMNEDIVVAEDLAEEEYEAFEKCSVASTVAKVVIGVGAVAAAGVAVWKNRDKIKAKHEQKQLEKWRKKGYVISKKPEILEAAKDIEDEFEELEEVPEEENV